MNFSPFLEKIICKCNLRCRNGGHFHCPLCAATIIRRDTIIAHLQGCRNKQDNVKKIKVGPLTTLVQSPSPETLPALLSAVNIDHSYIQTASPNSPAVAEINEDPDAPEEPDLVLSPITPSPEDPVAPGNTIAGDVPPSHVTCPYCPLVLYKRNLSLHVKRKHGPDKFAQFQLSSTADDQRDGLSKRPGDSAFHCMCCSRHQENNLWRYDRWRTAGLLWPCCQRPATGPPSPPGVFIYVFYTDSEIATQGNEKQKKHKYCDTNKIYFSYI